MNILALIGCSDANAFNHLGLAIHSTKAVYSMAKFFETDFLSKLNLTDG